MNALATDWLIPANQGSTRNDPLHPRLTNALGSFLPQMGVSFEYFSGGQGPAGSGDARTGSTRHDHGLAADGFFYMNGRRLDWRNPQDIPILQDIVRRGRAAGLSGFGAGPNYMTPGSMHIGFGNEAVWGAGGRSANAPDWLREAFYDAPAGQAAPGVSAAPSGVPPIAARSGTNALAMGVPAPMFRYENEIDPEDFQTRRRFA